MDDAVKLCPECDAEYHPGIAVCADCGVPLVLKTAVRDAQQPLPFSDELVAVQTETLPWIKQLADRLAKAGIRCHVQPAHVVKAPHLDRADYYHTLYVRPQHLGIAQRLDQSLHADASQDNTWTAGASPPDASTCPACGSPFMNAQGICADCGLHVDTA